MTAKTQRYVLMGGQVFRWEEKAPFPASGRSILGAVEFDKARGELRCHECGVFRVGLSSHIASHGISAKEYRRRHGIRNADSLNAPSVTAARSRNMKRLRAAGVMQQGFDDPVIREAATAASQGKRPKINAALRNEKNTCSAQITARIRELAIRVGGTPSQADTQDFDPPLHRAALNVYGTWAKACEASGLVANAVSRKKYSQAILIEALRDFHVVNGRMPKASEWGAGRLASQTTYIQYFGSTAAAVFAAGLALVAKGLKDGAASSR